MGLALEWAVGALWWAWGPGAEPANCQGQGGALGWANKECWGCPAALGWTCSTQAPPGQLPSDPHNCMRSGSWVKTG